MKHCVHVYLDPTMGDGKQKGVAHRWSGISKFQPRDLIAITQKKPTLDDDLNPSLSQVLTLEDICASCASSPT